MKRLLLALLVLPACASSGSVRPSSPQAEARATLEGGLEACSQALRDEQLTPDGFFASRQLYARARDEALTRDATLRSSSARFAPRGSTGASYDAWITRCDVFFESNEEAFRAAARREATATRARP